ncbi:hypothetical protein [Borborobacter arsenicus]|nr:hypothetical protein [Pseudaminobacter arsenicus]
MTELTAASSPSGFSGMTLLKFGELGAFVWEIVHGLITNIFSISTGS